jgi:DNA invertase Pin-like site-specific DNA recombinase
MGRARKDPEARRIAISLLARGLGSPGEIAELAGVSRQVVEDWAKRAGMDWRRIKRSKLTKAWRVEMRNGARLVQSKTT